jgi:hypothetical protein
MIGNLIIFALIMIVSSYGIIKLHKFNKGIRYILNIDNRILDYGKMLTDSLLSQLRFERKFIIAKDFILYKQFLSEKAEFNKFFSEVFLIADTDE